MVSVRREVLAVVAHRDDGIEEAPDLFDDAHEPLHVGIGRIALIRRRLDAIHRQRDDQKRRSAEGIAVAPEYNPSVSLDAFGQAVDLASGRVLHLGRGEADRGWRHFLSSNGLFLRSHASR